MPCRLCRSRGWKCGVEDKVLGPRGQLTASERSNVLSSFTARQYVFPVSRISPVPEEQALTSFDATLLRFVLEKMKPRHLLAWAPLIDNKWHNDSFPISSESFRYAILVLASRKIKGFSNQNTYRYLDKTYQLLRRSASAGEYREVVYTSCALWAHEYLSNRYSCNDHTFIHCLGTWQTIACIGRITQNRVRQDEFVQMERLALWFLRTECDHLFTEAAKSVGHAKKDRLLELFHATSSMVDWHWENLHSSGHSWHIPIYFHLFSRLYLWLRISEEGSEPDLHFVATVLKRLVDQIIQPFPRIPDHNQGVLTINLTTEEVAEFRLWVVHPIDLSPDIVRAFVRWNFARLRHTTVIIKSTLLRRPRIDDSQAAISAASSLLTLSRNNPPQLTADRYSRPSVIVGLFLAGLVFGQSQDMFGIRRQSLVANIIISCRSDKKGNRASSGNCAFACPISVEGRYCGRYGRYDFVLGCSFRLPFSI